jgi:transposase InsO family protein
MKFVVAAERIPMPENPSDAPLVTSDHAEAVALFRAQIIGPLSRRELDHGELAAELRVLSKLRFRPPRAVATRRFSVPTLERWLYRYKKGGLEALRPARRCDAGRAQGLCPELRELLADIRREHPSASVPLIRRTLVADGRLDAAQISDSTLRRFYVEQKLDRVSLREGKTLTTRLRWQAERPNALWHGDVCHAQALEINGHKRPLRIHALLDDASRFIIAIEAHHQEREIDMLGLLVRALRRHGAPDALYLDNGATYRGEALRLGCERLGITLLHARPYDAPARGKMERFWRTLREGCLDFLGPVASLDDVHVKLRLFVEQHYHQTPHGSLLGRAPASVFLGTGEARPIAEEKLRQSLTVYEQRRVRRDTTLSLDGVDWELSQGFLAGRVVTVARNLVEPDAPPWVEYEGKRLSLHPVDPVANGQKARPPKKVAPSAPSRPVPFDPIGALAPQSPKKRGTE